MQTINASFEIVTPMFIGGAQFGLVELRPPSIKGALRFWWRAMQWGGCLQATGQNESAALRLLHQQEAVLFGAAAKADTRQGQGLFFIKLKLRDESSLQQTWPSQNINDGAGYLGYGLVATNKQPHRQAINPCVFDLTLVLKEGISPLQVLQLQHALQLWGLLGGLGARARRGFGSVNLVDLGGQSVVFKNQEDYGNAIKELLANITLAPAMPLFTALNKDMRVVVWNHKPDKDYKHLMDTIGKDYKEARTAVPLLDRAAFGLPLAGLKGKADKVPRRSSPLFLHIHKVGVFYLGVFCFIPAQFHPNYQKGNDLDFFNLVQAYLNKMTDIYP